MRFYLVTSILIIATFLIILAFLFRTNLGLTAEEDVCKLSILKRATLPQAVQGYIPLQCTTKKTCLTLNGEKCSQFIGEDAEIVKVPKDPKKGARVIEEESAKALYECWRLAGEGKLDLFSGSKDGVINDFIYDIFREDKVSPTCLICSRVALAKDLTESDEGKAILAEVDVASYMRKEKVPDPGSADTYLKALAGSRISDYSSEFKKKFESSGKIGEADEIAYVFMQILVSKDSIDAAIDKGANTGIALGGLLFLGPVGSLTNSLGPKAFIAKTVFTALGAGTSGFLAYQQAEKNQEIAAFHCGQLTSAGKSGGGPVSGCSVVKPINYDDVGEINNLCHRIEGNI